MQILLIDDEADAFGMLGHALSQYGCSVAIMRTALGALRELRRVNFDAVILDGELGGGLSGVELAWKIRKRNPDIKLIVFSAIHHGPEIDREIENLGASFFVKPISAKTLLDAISDGPTAIDGERP
jgi:DNA-binding NtrC family response regulator